MENLSYAGKNIIITGGSKGIGREIALQLAQYGANVFLVARNEEALIETRKLIEKNAGTGLCHYHACDVSKKAQVKATVSLARKTMGSIDGLINNAGTSYPEYFENIPLDNFDHLVQVDYLGSVYFTKEVYEHLKPGSFITFTSSVVGYMGVFGFTSYAGPKFALIGLAESLQQEAHSRGIQISVLCPPDTETPGFSEEQKTKPFETQKLSEGAKLMSAGDVAQIFLKKLKAGKFLITCNFESALFYRLHGAFPGLVRWVMKRMVASARKKKPREA